MEEVSAIGFTTPSRAIVGSAKGMSVDEMHSQWPQLRQHWILKARYTSLEVHWLQIHTGSKISIAFIGLESRLGLFPPLKACQPATLPVCNTLEEMRAAP